MRALVYNIMYAQPKPVNPVFSSDLKQACNEMLMKDPRKRPSVNSILGKPVIRQRISTILNPTEVKAEFSHTILHGMDILKSKAVQCAPSSTPTAPARAAPAPAPAPVVNKNQLNVGAAGGMVYRPPGQAAAPASVAAPAPVRQAAQAPVPSSVAARPSQPAAVAARNQAPPVQAQRRPEVRPVVQQPPQQQINPRQIPPYGVPTSQYKPAPIAEIPPYKPPAAAPAPVPRPSHVDNRPAPVPRAAPNSNPAPHAGHAKARAEYQHLRAGGGLQELIEKQKEQQRALQAQLARLQGQCDDADRKRQAVRRAPPAPAAAPSRIAAEKPALKPKPKPAPVSRYAQGPSRAPAKTPAAAPSRAAPVVQSQRPSSAALLRAQQDKNRARREEMDRQERQQKVLMKERLEAAKKKVQDNRAKAKADYDRPWTNNMRRGQGLVDEERAVERAYIAGAGGGGLPIPPGAVKAKAAAAKKPAWVGVMEEPGAKDADMPPPPPYFAAKEKAKEMDAVSAVGSPPAVGGAKEKVKPGINTIVGGVNDQLSRLQSQLEGMKNLSPAPSPPAAGAPLMPPAPPPSGNVAKVSVVQGPSDMHALRQKQREAGGVQPVSVQGRGLGSPPGGVGMGGVKAKPTAANRVKAPSPAPSEPLSSPPSMEDRAEKARLKREDERRALREMIQHRRAEAHASAQVQMAPVALSKAKVSGGKPCVKEDNVVDAMGVDASMGPAEEAEVEDAADTEEEVGAASGALLHATVLMTEQLREQVVAAVLAAAGVDSAEEEDEEEDEEEEDIVEEDDMADEEAPPQYDCSVDLSPEDESEPITGTASAAGDDDDASVSSKVTTEEEAAEYDRLMQNMQEALALPEKPSKTKSTVSAASVGTDEVAATEPDAEADAEADADAEPDAEADGTDEDEDDDYFEEESVCDDSEGSEMDSQDLEDAEEEELADTEPYGNGPSAPGAAATASSEEEELTEEDLCGDGMAGSPVDPMLKTTAGAALGGMIGGADVAEKLAKAQEAAATRVGLLTRYSEEQVEQACALLRGIDDEEGMTTMGAEEDDERLLGAMEGVLGIEGLADLDEFLFLALHS